MRLLWLPQVLRNAGLTVHEVSGWRTRSAKEDPDASTFQPRGLIIHETRGSASSTDAGEIGVLVNGRPGLSGPIAQCYIGRNGHWHVVAAGLCHHVKQGWGGPFAGLGNSRLMGVEPAHSATENWADKPVQYESYVRGVAAILRHTRWPPPVGHKEHQPGDKPDPEFNMDAFRRDVRETLTEGDGVSAADVVDGLDNAVAWVSTGVKNEANAQGWGNEVSSRALLEYIFSAVVLRLPGKFAEVLATIVADPANTIQLTEQQVTELATLLSARLPAAEAIADAVADEAAARLGRPSA